MRNREDIDLALSRLHTTEEELNNLSDKMFEGVIRYLKTPPLTLEQIPQRVLDRAIELSKESEERRTYNENR